MGKQKESFRAGLALDILGIGVGMIETVPDWFPWALITVGTALLLWSVGSWLWSASIPLPLGKVGLHGAAAAFYRGTPASLRSMVVRLNGAEDMLDYAKVAFVQAASEGSIVLYGRLNPAIAREPITGQIGALHPKGEADLGYPGDNKPQWFDVQVRWQDIAKVRRKYI